MKLFPLLLASVVTSVLPRTALAFCRTTNCACKSDATCATDCPKDSNGCPSTGTPVSWAGACVGFSLNVGGTLTLTADQWTDAIVQAFDTWMFVDCGGGQPPSIGLVQLRDVSCSESSYNPDGPNVNVVYFTDSGWNGGGDIDSTLALTTVSFDTGPNIFDADMAINSARHDFTVTDTDVSIDLVSVVTHEVGHFLGIAHSPDPTAVMYYAYQPGTIKRQLTADDIAAVCAIYPPGRQAGTCNPIPQGGLETSCGPAPASGGCNTAPEPPGRETVTPMLLGVAGVTALRSLLRRRRAR